MSSDDERCESARTCDSCMYCRVCQARRQQGNWIAELCDTYQRRIDRDALLALADEIEFAAREYAISTNDIKYVFASLLPKYASRIREALGVSE